MGTSYDGKIRGRGIWWWVGVFYVDSSTASSETSNNEQHAAFLYDNIIYVSFILIYPTTKESYLGNPTRLSITSSTTVCHGWYTGIGGMVDGKIRFGR